jgi:hypothetical protein
MWHSEQELDKEEVFYTGACQTHPYWIQVRDMEQTSDTAPTDDEARREIGDEAVWSLSSAKPGNGVDQLRDSRCSHDQR